MRRVIAIVLGTILVLVGVVAAFDLLFNAENYGDRVGRCRSELHVFGYAIRTLVQREKLTPEDWDRIHDMSGLSSRLVPMFQQGGAALIDPWGQAYLLEKRDEGDQIIVVIRSSHVVPRKWHEQRRRILGVQVTISRPEGEVADVKDLWNRQ